MPMQTVFAQPADLGNSKVWRWIALSLGFHLLVVLFVVSHRPPMLKSGQLPGDWRGHQLLLTYLPGEGSSAAAPQAPPRARPVPDRLPALSRPSVTPPPSPDPTASLTAENSTGTDTLGQGDIQIASMVSHPRPTPDLSQLPAGTRGDVIVDIVIDANGRVAKTTMEHGLGHGIDEEVLATVQQWTFQPAMRDGVPVASEQELLFHYERG